MLRYIAGKLARTVVVLLLVSFFTVVLLDLAPGDPAYAILGADARPDAVEAVHADLGLDRPIYERYADWLGDVVRGDFGTSYRANVSEAARVSVTDEITSALPITAELVVLSFLLALLAAVPIGVYAAYRKGGAFDRAASAVFSVLMSTPVYVTAPLLVFVLVLQAGLLPATGWVSLSDDPLENLRHVILPASALALEMVPGFAIVLRADMIGTLNEDFILQARAKGLSPATVLVRHALRPSSFSLLTMAGITLGKLIGGAVIVETLFAFPGLGSLLLESIQARDVNTVQGVVMFVALAYVLINGAVDLAYTYLDPRVRLRATA
ncbi:MAG TPA: ABC transporter permease [Acidimicrobiales bacterium]|nr:ABC transporter permease [Acidimicrobiales bacterium]